MHVGHGTQNEKFIAGETVPRAMPVQYKGPGKDPFFSEGIPLGFFKISGIKKAAEAAWYMKVWWPVLNYLRLHLVKRIPDRMQ